jgi:large subunit ribosomal protein L13
MMPKNKIARHMMLKLKLFVGPNHTHQAQCPIPLEALSGRPTPSGAIYVTPPKTKDVAVDAAVPAPAATHAAPASAAESGEA